jgi:hypothetical protein
MRKLTILCILFFLKTALTAQDHADCVTAMDICKKQTYNIDHASGEGKDRREADFISCFMNGENFGQAEENSTWIKFEIKQGGYLTFTITPNRPQDDIDFVVFKLPSNGDCAKKQIVRCMAAGAQESEYATSPCMGKTGLRDGEKDTSEDAGCADPDDNTWLAPLKVSKGEKYVLLVSNVSTKGPGFSINFTGSAKLPCDDDPPVVQKSTPTKPTRKPVKETPAPPPQVVASAPVVSDIPSKVPPPPTIVGRGVRVTQTIKVKDDNIDVSVWDSQVEDGDIISIYVNEKKVLSNIYLTKKPKEYLLKLEGEENYITLYSESFGAVEPNTASIKIKDSSGEQVYNLLSTRDFQESIRVVKQKD